MKKLAKVYRGSKRFQDLRQHVLGQVREELACGLNPFAASGASRHHDSAPALRDARWLVNERVPMVFLKFPANSGEDCDFVHSAS